MNSITRVVARLTSLSSELPLPASLPKPKKRLPDLNGSAQLLYEVKDLDKILKGLLQESGFKQTKDAPGTAIFKSKKTRQTVVVYKKPTFLSEKDKTPAIEVLVSIAA